MQILSTSFATLETANLTMLPFSDEVQNNYKYIKGKLVLEGRQPDGDSVAFVADNVDLFRDVYRSYLLKPSSRDGSVQLRFEGIDAPELHYGNVFQPAAKEARTHLLKDILGFTEIEYKEKRQSQPSSCHRDRFYT
jgi:endonuclease YncB( thermonuclease family)